MPVLRLAGYQRTTVEVQHDNIRRVYIYRYMDVLRQFLLQG